MARRLPLGVCGPIRDGAIETQIFLIGVSSAVLWLSGPIRDGAIETLDFKTFPRRRQIILAVRTYSRWRD